MTPETLRDKLATLTAMLSPDFDWQGHYDADGEEPKELFRKCLHVVTIDDEEYEVRRFACGSYKSKDTPRALYRLLFLAGPQMVDFSGMYKSWLFDIHSPDRRFLVQVEFWKYELALRFFAPEGCIAGEGTFVWCGIPGSDNGVHCTDEDGNAFFDLVTKAVEHEWDVYSGNNFKV